MPPKYNDHESVVQWLSDHCERVVGDHVPDAKRHGHDLRWGGKTGTGYSVRLTGARRGTFMAFCEGWEKGADMIGFLAWHHGWQQSHEGRVKAFDYAREVYGLGVEVSEEEVEKRRRLANERRKQREIDQRHEEERSRRIAKKIWDEGKSANGWQLEYLQGRGIVAPDSPEGPRWPGAMRIIKESVTRVNGESVSFPAICFAIQGPHQTSDGTWREDAFLGVQRILLDPAKRDRKAQLPAPHAAKITNGTPLGGAIKMRKGKDALHIVEGPENAMSLASVLPAGHAIWAVPGASLIPAVEVPDRVRRVFIWADKDKAKQRPDGSEWRTGEQAALKLRERIAGDGRRVHIMLPPQEGEDWNDLLEAGSLGAVATELLRHADEEEWGPVEIDPPLAGPATEEEARHELMPVEAPVDQEAIGNPLAQYYDTDSVNYDNSGHVLNLMLQRYILVGGQDRCFYDTHKDEYISFASFDSYWHHAFHVIKQQCANMVSAGSQEAKTFAKWFIGARNLIRVDSITSKPNAPMLTEDVVNGTLRACYNIWVPPQVTPQKGNVGILIEHLRMLCGYEDQAYDALVRWMAHLVQKPEERIDWSPVFLGGEGVGKSFLCHILTALVGTKHGWQTTADQLGSQFNEQLQNCLLWAIEEIRLATRDGQKQMQRLRNEITATTRTINPKGFRAYVIPNRTRLVLTSNERDPLLLHNDDRRFLILHCAMSQSEILERNPNYFRDLWTWLGEDGLARVAAWLHGIDLAGFDPSMAPPMTAAKERAQELSYIEASTSLGLLMSDCILAKEGPFQRDVVSMRKLYEWAKGEERAISYKALRQAVEETNCRILRNGARVWDPSSRGHLTIVSIREHEKHEAMSDEQICQEVNRAPF